MECSYQPSKKTVWLVSCFFCWAFLGLSTWATCGKTAMDMLPNGIQLWRSTIFTHPSIPVSVEIQKQHDMFNNKRELPCWKTLKTFDWPSLVWERKSWPRKYSSSWAIQKPLVISPQWSSWPRTDPDPSARCRPLSISSSTAPPWHLAGKKLTRFLAGSKNGHQWAMHKISLTFHYYMILR